MWGIKETNYICRIITDKEGKFKFDIMLRSEFLVTNGESYDKFEEASAELKKYLDKLYNFDTKPDLKGEKHFIINETIFE